MPDIDASLDEQAGKDRLLERLQAARPLVGRASALLSPLRWAALAAVSRRSSLLPARRPALARVALVGHRLARPRAAAGGLPARLPRAAARRARGLLVLALACVAIAAVGRSRASTDRRQLRQARRDDASARSGSSASSRRCRGSCSSRRSSRSSTPTRSGAGRRRRSTTNHVETFYTLSFAFPAPGEHERRNLGLPDLLFFALFLAAAARFDLRPAGRGSRWSSRSAPRWRSRSRGASTGLPALPLLSVAFLAVNARPDLWRRLRGSSRLAALEQRDRLDVRRVREHVHRADAHEPVAVVVASVLHVATRASSGCTRRRRSAAPRSAPSRRSALPGEAGARRVDDDDVRVAAALAQLLERPRRRCRRRRPRSRSRSARRSRSRRRRTPPTISTPHTVSACGASARPIVPMPQ